MPNNNQNQGGNNHGRNRGKQRPRRNNGGYRPRPNNPKFQGKTPALQGYVYEIRKGITRPWRSFDKVTGEIANYFGREFDYAASDYRTCLLQREFPELVEPTPPSTNPEDDHVGHVKWECALERYEKTLRKREQNKYRAFDIILGQCSPDLRIQVEIREGWEQVHQNYDVVGLLKLIEQVMISPNPYQYEVLGHVQAMQDFFTFRQGPNVSCSEYLDMFKDLVKTVLHYGGDLGTGTKIVRNYISKELKQEPDTLTKEAYNQAVEECREEFLAICLLHSADPIRFESLKIDFHNRQLFSPGKSVYPKKLIRAFSILVDYENMSHRHQRQY